MADEMVSALTAGYCPHRRCIDCCGMLDTERSMMSAVGVDIAVIHVELTWPRRSIVKSCPNHG